MAFMLSNHLNFIDNFQFMSSSLDKLVSNLPKEVFTYTSEEFTGKKLNLMSQRGVYPYDYMDCFEKCYHTELPATEQFYSILNDQHVTNGEYDQLGKPSTLRQQVNTMTYTLRVMYLYQLTCSKALERPVCNTTN